MAKIMVQYGKPSRSSRTKSVRSSFGKTIMGMAFRDCFLKYGWEKFQIGTVYSLTEDKDYSCLWTTYNWLERNKICIRRGKYS